ncbi:MAG: aminotransferase class V-fold PLP-dependent enzyme [Ruminococcus sp.]|nr:aminotransferase class V-fold PLP-dependent enzyme [Ruminococcus sp.]
MIYLDNSATTFPKPQQVINSVNQAMRFYSANPGRSGHDLSLKAAQKIFDCRQAVCSLFNISDESKVVFTSGCTQSLNTVIKGVLKQGDHCVISSFEHNSVLRPLEKLKQQNKISYSVANVYPQDDDKTVDSFRKAFNERTKLVVCTHASNVFGFRLPVERICALCHNYGILFCLDAAQSAGVIDIDINDSGFDYVCCAGHKGLYGPMGVGVLVINSDVLPESLVEGGTGSNSQDFLQPDFTPDKYESGTLNVVGICGLKNGIDFVMNKSPFVILNTEMSYIRMLYKALSKNKNIVLYSKMPTVENFVPVLSFSVKGMNSEKVASYLNSKYSIAVRAGLHCSPLAHKSMKSLGEGTVRIAPSVFTTENDIKRLIFALNNLKI